MRYDCSACPPDVTRRWRRRYWPLHIEFTRTTIAVSWGTLAGRHKGMHP